MARRRRQAQAHRARAAGDHRGRRRTRSRTAGSSFAAIAQMLDVPVRPEIRRIASRYVGPRPLRLLRRRPGRHGRPDRARRHARLGLRRRPRRHGRAVAIVTAFADAVEAFLAETFRLEPVFATGIGEHAHDARWPDLTPPAGPSGWPSTERWLADVRGHDRPAGRRRDRSRPAHRRARGLAGSPRRSCARTPGTRSTGSTSSGEGLFTLLAREFAPLADRLTSTAGRLEGLPAVFEAARATLVGSAGRPVGRFQTETALRQLAGDRGADRRRAVGRRGRGPTDPGGRRPATAPRRRGRDRPGGRGRLRDPPARRRPARQRRRGPARRGALRREDAPHDALRDADAGADHGRGRARVRARSAPRWSGSRASSGRPGARDAPRARATSGALVRGVLDAIARGASRRPTTCSTSAARRTPGSRRSAASATSSAWPTSRSRSSGRRSSCARSAARCSSSPGPLDKGQKAFFAITPMPDDWTEEQRESNLREDNDRMLRLLTIHEAVPGHYLQGVYANRCPSIVRAIFAQRPVRRGLGRLRDPGDDGRRLRRGRPGAACSSTGSSTCARSPTRSSTRGSTATG